MRQLNVRPASRVNVRDGWAATDIYLAHPLTFSRRATARTSTARQELTSQLEALRRAECHKIFQERRTKLSDSTPRIRVTSVGGQGEAGGDQIQLTADGNVAPCCDRDQSAPRLAPNPPIRNYMLACMGQPADRLRRSADG